MESLSFIVISISKWCGRFRMSVFSFSLFKRWAFHCFIQPKMYFSFKHLALLSSILPLFDNCTIFICYTLLHWASGISCHSEMTMLYWQINLITFDKLTSFIAYLLWSMHVGCVCVRCTYLYLSVLHPPVSDKQSKRIPPKYTYMFIGKNVSVLLLWKWERTKNVSSAQMKRNNWTKKWSMDGIHFECAPAWNSKRRST